jgi:hypothetical protein
MITVTVRLPQSRCARYGRPHASILYNSDIIKVHCIVHSNQFHIGIFLNQIFTYRRFFSSHLTYPLNISAINCVLHLSGATQDYHPVLLGDITDIPNLDDLQATHTNSSIINEGL